MLASIIIVSSCSNRTFLSDAEWQKKDYVLLINKLVEQFHAYRFSMQVSDTVIIHDELSTTAFDHFIKDKLAFETNCQALGSFTRIQFDLNDEFGFNSKVMNVNLRGDRRYQNGEYIVISPIMTGRERNQYCHLCQTSNAESVTTRLYLLENDKKGRLKIVRELDGYTAYY